MRRLTTLLKIAFRNGARRMDAIYCSSCDCKVKLPIHSGKHENLFITLVIVSGQLPFDLLPWNEIFLMFHENFPSGLVLLVCIVCFYKGHLDHEEVSAELLCAVCHIKHFIQVFLKEVTYQPRPVDIGENIDPQQCFKIV